mgnify:FL=1
MKKTALILIISGFAITGFIACEKDDIEKPTLKLEFNTVKSESNLKNTAANSIEFTSGQIIFESIEFESESENDTIELEFEIESYITLDFATGETTPDLSPIEIFPGNYTEIELEFELWDQTEQASIDLSGTWTDTEGTPHPIRLTMPLGQTFSLEIEGEFIVDENTAMVAQITIDPSAWFMGEAGELLPSATTDNEGIIVVSPDQNYNIYDIVKDAIDRTSEIEIEIE